MRYQGPGRKLPPLKSNLRPPPTVDARALLGLTPDAPKSLQAYATHIYGSISPNLRESARDGSGARALILGILFDAEPANAEAQVSAITDIIDHSLLDETLRLQELLTQLGPGYRLTLLELALPALKRISSYQYQEFQTLLSTMAEADPAFDLFEYLVHRILVNALDPIFVHNWTPDSPEECFLPQTSEGLKVIFSALAWMGHEDDDQATEAVHKAVEKLRMNTDVIAYMSMEHCTLGEVDKALLQLKGLVPNHKRNFLLACHTCLSDKQEISLKDAELLRAIANAVAFPLPQIRPSLFHS